MSDFGTNIRTIARTREIEDKIAALLRKITFFEKADIFGRRAIAYGATAGATNVVSGAKNTVIPPGTKQAVNSAIEAAKKALDPNTAQTSTTKVPGKESNGTDKSANAYTYLAGTTTAKNLLDSAQSIVDGAIDSANSELSHPDGEGGGVGGSDTITGIFAKDYLTGNDFLMSLDGMYRIPEGWTDPNVQPTDPDWELGYYWTCGRPFLPGLLYSTSSSQIMIAVLGDWATGGPSRNPASIVGDESFSVPSPGGLRVHFTIVDPTGTYPYSADRIACPGSGEAAGVCPLTPPIISYNWPAVGNYILALIGGLWTPNPFDTEVPFHMQGTQSAVPFSMGDGRYGMMEPAIGGGQLLYEVTTAPPYTGDQRLENATGTAIYFRPDNTIGHFIPAEQLIYWIPKRR